MLKVKGNTDFKNSLGLKNCWVISIIPAVAKVYFVNNHTIDWSVSMWLHICILLKMPFTACKVALNPSLNNTV